MTPEQCFAEAVVDSGLMISENDRNKLFELFAKKMAENGHGHFITVNEEAETYLLPFVEQHEEREYKVGQRVTQAEIRESKQWRFVKHINNPHDATEFVYVSTDGKLKVTFDGPFAEKIEENN